MLNALCHITIYAVCHLLYTMLHAQLYDICIYYMYPIYVYFMLSMFDAICYMLYAICYMLEAKYRLTEGCQDARRRLAGNFYGAANEGGSSGESFPGKQKIIYLKAAKPDLV